MANETDARYTDQEITAPIQDTQQIEQTAPQENPSEPAKEVDWLSLSDEDFLKIAENENTQPVQSVNIAPSQTQNAQQEQSPVQQPSDTQEQQNPEEPATEEPAKLTPEDFFNSVTSEFIANGRPVKITDPNDIKTLMQKGLNYNKKMEAIKPHLRIVKTLEQNNLIDPEKLQFAIDLVNGDKTAIAKLLKETNTDSYELPNLDETPYTPKSRIATEKEVLVEDVLKDICESPEGNFLMKEITSKWDQKSMEILSEAPTFLYTLKEDFDSGLYKDTIDTIELERALGNIPEKYLKKPFIDLYTLTSELVLAKAQAAMQNNPAQQQQQQRVLNTAPQVIGNNIQQNIVKTAKSTAPASARIPHNAVQVQDSPTKTVSERDILGMSDAEFAAFEKALQNVSF